MLIQYKQWLRKVPPPSTRIVFVWEITIENFNFKQRLLILRVELSNWLIPVPIGFLVSPKTGTYHHFELLSHDKNIWATSRSRGFSRFLFSTGNFWCFFLRNPYWYQLRVNKGNRNNTVVRNAALKIIQNDVSVYLY